MKILAMIIIIVGIALIIVGGNISKYIPPNYYETEDKEFIQLLKNIGRMIAVIGSVFLLIGFIFMCL